MEKMKKKGLKDLRPGARQSFLELCGNLGHILIRAQHLEEKEIIELTEKGLFYMKLQSFKVVDRLMKKCGL